MKKSSAIFSSKLLPYLLILPQLLITAIFFVWPASQALWLSVQRSDPFGIVNTFVGLENFKELFSDPLYLSYFGVTFMFSFWVTAIGLIISLFLAAVANQIVFGKKTYRSVLMIPYAVAPAVVGVLMSFLFSPGIGIIADFFDYIGYDWNFSQNSGQAMFMVVLASIWQRLSYNFLFFLAALQSIPLSLQEAAALDGAGPVRRFFSVSLPLILPVTFFLFIINLVYALFDTFPIIDIMTKGGPIRSTTTLVYKIYQEGFMGLDIGSSSAQSVVLMLVVTILIFIQFRFVERKVHYQ